MESHFHASPPPCFDSLLPLPLYFIQVEKLASIYEDSSLCNPDIPAPSHTYPVIMIYA